MSFDKLKTLFSRTFENKDDESIISTFINSNRRSMPINQTA